LIERLANGLGDVEVEEDALAFCLGYGDKASGGGEALA